MVRRPLCEVEMLVFDGEGTALNRVKMAKGRVGGHCELFCECAKCCLDKSATYLYQSCT